MEPDLKYNKCSICGDKILAPFLLCRICVEAPGTQISGMQKPKEKK